MPPQECLQLSVPPPGPGTPRCWCRASSALAAPGVGEPAPDFTDCRMHEAPRVIEGLETALREAGQPRPGRAVCRGSRDWAHSVLLR